MSTVKSPGILGRVFGRHGIASYLYLAGLPTPRIAIDATRSHPRTAANEMHLSDTVCMATHVYSQEFLKSKSLTVSGKKPELIDRVGEYLDTHT